MASANLRFRIDGGAIHTGTVSDTPGTLAGVTVALSASSYAGWRTAQWQIAEFPDGFACPSGWTTNTTGFYVYNSDPVNGTTPPDFVLPSTGDINAGQWGKFEFRLLVNGVTYSQKCGIEILSNNGVHDLAYGEEDEFGGAQRQWIEDQKTNLRTFDGALAGGAPVDAKYLIKEANASLPQATVWTTITTTVDFTSTSTIPCSFNRQQATTNTAVDVMRIESSSSTTAANNFGVACLYRAANKDAGRLKFIFTDIAGASEDSQFIVQLRTAGAALADAFLLSGTTWQVPQLAGFGAGLLAVDNSGNITWTTASTGAPTDAPYLTVGAVSGLSAEVDITAISTTVAFASSTVVPISITRGDTTTNTTLDVLTSAATSTGTAAVNFGTTHLYKAEDASGSTADIGRHGYRWTNAGALTAESEYIIQLRHAGDGLATKLTLSGAGRLTVADLTLSGLATGYMYATAGVVSIGATQPAPSDAAFLTVGPVTGLSAEVDVNAIGTTVVFGSTSTEPCAFRRTDSDTNGLIGVCTFRRASSGTAAANNGGLLTFEAQDASGGFPVAGYMSWRLTTATAGGEVSELGLWTRTGGGALTKNAYLTGAGNWTVVGTVSGANVTTDGAFDRATAGTAAFATSTATAVTVGKTGITVTIPGAFAVTQTSAFADVVTINKDAIGTTKTVGQWLYNATNSGTQVSPMLAWSAYNGGTRVNVALQWEPQSTSRGLLKIYYGTGSTAPASGGNTYYDVQDSNLGEGWISPGFYINSAISVGFRFLDSSNRGGMDLDGSKNLRLKSYSAAGFLVSIYSDAGSTLTSSPIAVDGSGKGRVVLIPHAVTSSGGNVTFPLATSQNIRHTTTEATTLAFTGATPGMRGTLDFIQGGTGRVVTFPTNGSGVEYSADLVALGVTAIVDATANTRTVLTYYVTDSPNTRVYITSRSVTNPIP